MMSDREKVISDLEEQLAWIRDNDFHKFHGWGHAVMAMRDALDLLKAQEPIVPIMVKGKRYTYLKCGYCCDWLPQNEKPNYCSNCGKAVKWGE